MGRNHYKNARNRITKRYHFCYNFIDYQGRSGIGYYQLNLKGKFSVEDICKFIENEKNLKNVVIMSWQKNIIKTDRL